MNHDNRIVDSDTTDEDITRALDQSCVKLS
jgi:hypothetical protein